MRGARLSIIGLVLAALAYAIEYPDDVAALVLIASIASPVEGHRMSAAQARLTWPAGGPLTAHLLGPIAAPDAVAGGYVDAFYPREPDAVAVERGRLHFSRPGTLLASARDWNVLETELAKLAARHRDVRVPVEALSANQDRIVGPAHARYLADHVVDLHLENVDGAGDQLMATHPDQVVQAVRRARQRARP